MTVGVPTLGAVTRPWPHPRPPPLAGLAPLLAEEPALRAVIARQPTVAVPDAARALFVAALAGVTTRRPLLLAVPTGAEAERLARDLGQFLGDGEVELFPAWETLPFERVSPSFETMGRRLRVMWRLRVGRPPPAVVVAPVRALVQRLGPHVEDVEPVVVRPGDQIDRDELVERLVAGGYRREYQVEARGEVAVRGSIVDVYPSTDDHPVRIDLWGDEVDRLSAFSVADQRSTHDVAEACIFPTPRAAPDRRGARARRRAASRSSRGAASSGSGSPRASCSTAWSRGCRGSPTASTCSPTCCPTTALVLLVEPKRMRDRAQELLDEEAALAATLAVTWGAGAERDLPRLSLRLRPPARAHRRRRGVVAVDARRPRHAARSPRARSTRWSATPTRSPAACARSPARATASSSRPRAPVRRSGCTTSSPARASTPAPGAPAPGAVRLLVAPLERGVVLPGAQLALVAEADLTGRRRVHRRARGARRGQRLLRRPRSRATTSCTTSTASAATWR